MVLKLGGQNILFAQNLPQLCIYFRIIWWAAAHFPNYGHDDFSIGLTKIVMILVTLCHPITTPLRDYHLTLSFVIARMKKNDSLLHNTYFQSSVNTKAMTYVKLLFLERNYKYLSISLSCEMSRRKQLQTSNLQKKRQKGLKIHTNKAKGAKSQFAKMRWNQNRQIMLKQAQYVSYRLKWEKKEKKKGKNQLTFLYDITRTLS